MTNLEIVKKLIELYNCDLIVIEPSYFNTLENVADEAGYRLIVNDENKLKLKQKTEIL